MLVLFRIWRSVSSPVVSDEDRGPKETSTLEPRESVLARLHGRLPGVFWLFAAASAAISAGLVTFAIIAYHLTQDHVVSLAAVPSIYAAAMGAEALAALGSGWLFDRTRGGALLGLPAPRVRRTGSSVRPSPLVAIAGALLSGVRREAYLTPPSRRWLPTSSQPPDWPRRTGCSPLCKAPQPSRGSHGRCTVRAITTDTDCGRGSYPDHRPGLADRNSAATSKDQNQSSVPGRDAELPSAFAIIPVVGVIAFFSLLSEWTAPARAGPKPV